MEKKVCSDFCSQELSTQRVTWSYRSSSSNDIYNADKFSILKNKSFFLTVKMTMFLVVFLKGSNLLLMLGEWLQLDKTDRPIKCFKKIKRP